jgi:hypothetical protein
MAAVIAAGLGWVGYALLAETSSSNALAARVVQLQGQNSALRSDISGRRADIAAAQTTPWLVEEARKLGYVLPGERVFIVVTPGAQLPPDGGVEVGQLPLYNPSPAPQGASATPAPAHSTADPLAAPASPTPFIFVLPAPAPHH